MRRSCGPSFVGVVEPTYLCTLGDCATFWRLYQSEFRCVLIVRGGFSIGGSTSSTNQESADVTARSTRWHGPSALVGSSRSRARREGFCHGVRRADEIRSWEYSTGLIMRNPGSAGRFGSELAASAPLPGRDPGAFSRDGARLSEDPAWVSLLSFLVNTQSDWQLKTRHFPGPTMGHVFSAQRTSSAAPRGQQTEGRGRSHGKDRSWAARVAGAPGMLASFSPDGTHPALMQH
jgi:hypothetical protein